MGRPGHHDQANDSDDTSNTVYEYPIKISAALVDTDGSETLGNITINNLPSDVTLKDSGGNELNANSDGSYSVSMNENNDETTVMLVSPNQLDSDSLNSIQVSATAVEGDTKSVTVTSALDTNGLEALTYNRETNIDLSNLADEDKLNDIAKITMNEGKQDIALSIEDVLNVTSEDNKLIIHGDDSDSVTLKGDWNSVGTQTVDGNEFTVYQGSGSDGATASVLIDINQNNIHIDES